MAGPHLTGTDRFILSDPNSTRGHPGPRLGIIGGGQLARMTAAAAAALGCEVVILDRNPGGPAASCVSRVMVGDWNDPAALLRLAESVDAVTLENEFVDAAALHEVEAAGHPVFPKPSSIARIQDKFIQKQALASAGLPVPPFRAVESTAAVVETARDFGWPLVLKKRRNGYDGKGNYTLLTAADVPAGWLALGGGSGELLVEAFCPFTRELAVIVTRGRGGETAVYPVVESIQRDHICHVVIAPAPVPADLAAKAAETALVAVTSVGGIGSFGVEMFLMQDGSIVVNELAPRVHNTGHYTIEACECSQFENHVRAVLGWPLGRPRMVAPAAVMINLIGRARSGGKPTGLAEALAIPGAHIHLYGKSTCGIGRKMGHVTALGSGPGEALDIATRAAEKIGFGADD